MNEKKRAKETKIKKKKTKTQLIPFMALQLNVLATLGRSIMQFFWNWFNVKLRIAQNFIFILPWIK